VQRRSHTGRGIERILGVGPAPGDEVAEGFHLARHRGPTVSTNETLQTVVTVAKSLSALVIGRNSAFQYKGKAVDLRQVGRELGARYLREGSVKRSGDRVRIAAQLIDAAAGTHRWAQRYDRELHDVFAVQDEVARAIVATLAVHTHRAETERALLKPPATWEVYEYHLHGAEAFLLFRSRGMKASLYDARRLLEQSLAIDPDYARAAATLSWTYIHSYVEPFDGDYLSPAALDRGLELAETAVRLDPCLPQAHAQLGWVLNLKGQPDAAIAEFEGAFTLNPNFIDSRFALVLICSGDPARAINVLETNSRLDPFQEPLHSSWMGLANYMLKRYSEAVCWLRECVSRLPNKQVPHLMLASADAQSGQQLVRLKQLHRPHSENARGFHRTRLSVMRRSSLARAGYVITGADHLRPSPTGNRT
jgi:tetratricopeptide (TPR) repeat protein